MLVYVDADCIMCVCVWNIVYVCGWWQKATLSELIYMADNMAFLPYQVQDEPLYIIHEIDIIVSVSGSNILQSYKEVGSLFLCQNEVIIVSSSMSLMESCGVGPVSVDLCVLSTICV